MAMRILTVTLLASVVLSGVANAQDSKIGGFTVDLPVPESPAFSVLNLTPQSTTRPTSPQQLATSLINGVDHDGHLQSGVALDAQPYMIMYGHSVSWTKYKESYATRFASRAQVSVGTAKGATSDDKSAKLALGFRITVFDLGDPFRDDATATCLSDAQLAVLNAMQTLPPTATPAEIDAHQQDEMRRLAPEETKCRAAQAERLRRTVWNNSSLIVAGAPSWNSPTGNIDSLQSSGAGYWASFGYGFENIPGLEDSSQIIAQYRRRQQELVPAATEGRLPFLQDSDQVGLRMRVGTADSTGSFEYLFIRRVVGRTPNDTSSRYSLALERHISGNTWLTVSFGSDSGRSDHKNGAFVLSALNWSLNQRD
jgi:hypothetical protein